MSYKPNESQWMAYLYGELEGEEKQRVEEYLAQHPEAKHELESLTFVRQALGQVKDKEVIAPPIVMDDNRTRFFWNTNYGRTLLGIAASLTLLLLIGKWTGFRVTYTDQALTLGFGEVKEYGKPEAMPILTSNEVQEMINTSLMKNNEALLSDWEDTNQKLSESIRTNLASGKTPNFDELVRKASLASEEQVRQFALTLQADNARMIKDYLTLNSTDQRKYIEELLVDFAKYLEQQHRNDLQVLQARLNTIEQNTDVFKFETEQILTSLITSVDQSTSLATKN
jgi:hypothetical protein